MTINRPQSLRAAAVVGTSATRSSPIPGTAAAAATDSAAPPDSASSARSAITVNGKRLAVDVEPQVTLLDWLRERLQLTGTKKGCDEGACGACTVLVDGKRQNACLALVAQLNGANVTTIEGLADDSTLHAVQAAFIAHDAFQCGFCTPGQIMSAVACIDEGHAGDEASIREWMSGNLCRCAAYPQITAAVLDAAGDRGH